MVAKSKFNKYVRKKHRYPHRQVRPNQLEAEAKVRAFLHLSFVTVLWYAGDELRCVPSQEPQTPPYVWPAW